MTSPVQSGTAKGRPPTDLPRVTVVVPCYNDGATLSATIHSLEAQEPCELVIVDDGSDDEETLSELARLEAEGQRVLRQSNHGPAAARMAGVAVTSAPYVFGLDADDLAVPGALCALADALDSDPGAVMAWGDVETFGSSHVYRRGPRELDRWLMTYMNDMVGASVLLRRDALLDVGGWQLSYGYESWDLWMCFLERGWRGIYVPVLVLRYRLHGNRRLAAVMVRHDQAYAELRRRHRELFAARRANWRRSQAPLRLRLLLPLLRALPGVSPLTEQRLSAFVRRPSGAIAIRLERRAPALLRILRLFRQ